MATLTFPQERKVVEDPQEISRFLAGVGIWYSRFEGTDSLPEDASDAEILAAYKEPIQKLMAEGGYVTADVINVKSTTPGLDAMLSRFSKEHWHDEDEVRFIVHGRGLFHIHPPEGKTFSLEVVKGDMIRLPRGTHHWFDLCSDRTIRAIRLFQDQSGWTPHYTESGEDARFQPLCFGPSYIPAHGL
ncbi:MAG TPA: cupin domain-containing protein [Thermoanaerobaculia bacterium]|nr:cupin domain-containing protein [Thermoanaerobaculia bacterium]